MRKSDKKGPNSKFPRCLIFNFFCGGSWGNLPKNGTNLRSGELFLGFQPFRPLCISITFIYSWNTGYCLNEESHNWCQYVTRGKTSQYESPQLLQCLDGFPEWSQKSKLLLSFVHPTLYLYLYYCAATKVLPHPVLYNNISTPNHTPSIEHTINEWWSFPRMNRVTQQGTQTLSFFVLLWFSF